jgi:ribosomal protein S2
MKKYVFSKKANGVHLFDIQKLSEKIKIAARIIASIPDPSTIIVIIFLFLP